MKKPGLKPNPLGTGKLQLPGIHLGTRKSVNILQFSTGYFQQKF